MEVSTYKYMQSIKKQIKNLKRMSYFENISIFHNSMKTFTKLPYCKFKSKKALTVSK